MSSTSISFGLVLFLLIAIIVLGLVVGFIFGWLDPSMFKFKPVS